MSVTSLDTGRVIIDALELVHPSYEIPTSTGQNLILTISSVYNRTVQIGEITDLKLDYLLEVCSIVKTGLASSHFIPGNKYLAICFQGNSEQRGGSKGFNALKIVNELKNPEGVTQLLFDYKKRSIPRCHIKQGHSPFVTEILYPKYHNSLTDLAEEFRDIERELRQSEYFGSETEVSEYWKDREPILRKVYNPGLIDAKLEDDFHLRRWANRDRDKLFKHVYMAEFKGDQIQT